MKRSCTGLALAAILALALSAPAHAAGPTIGGLTSTTHPRSVGWYSNSDPIFAWSVTAGALGSCSLPSFAQGVAVAGGYAYVAAESSGLQVVDISDPAAPSIAGSCSLMGSALCVALDGNYAYVGSDFGLEIVDISKPTAPLWVTRCWIGTGGFGHDLQIVGTHVYVAAGDGDLQVVDVSNPTAPFIVGSCGVPGGGMGVAVSGAHAYVAALDSGLHIVDITDPTEPSVVGSCNLWANGVAVVGSRAYVAAGPSGFKVVDISDAGAPYVVGSCALPDSGRDVVLSGSYAYVANHTGLQKVDISSPAAPSIAGSWSLPAVRVALAGSHVFAAGGDQGLQVADLQPEFAHSFLLDRNSGTLLDTTPDSLADPAKPSVSYLDVDQGTWYFHVRAAATNTWGTAATLRINIDTRRPTATAPYAASARRGGTAALKYKVADPRPGSPKATVKIVVKNRAGKVVKTLKPVLKAVNTSLTWKFTVPRTWRVGTYRFYVYALRDSAGNSGIGPASNKLTVR